MQFAFGGHIDSVRIFGVVEEPEIARDASDGDLRRPALCGPVPRDAKIPGLVVLRWLAVVLGVDAKGGFPEVGPSVVGAVAVDVVNHPNGECAGHPKERKPMGCVSPGVKVDKAVPVDFCPEGCFTSLNPIASSNKPCERSCLGVVTK